MIYTYRIFVSTLSTKPENFVEDDSRLVPISNGTDALLNFLRMECKVKLRA